MTFSPSKTGRRRTTATSPSSSSQLKILSLSLSLSVTALCCLLLLSHEATTTTQSSTLTATAVLAFTTGGSSSNNRIRSNRARRPFHGPSASLLQVTTIPGDELATRGSSIYETIARKIVFRDDDDSDGQFSKRIIATPENLDKVKSYTNWISSLRVGIPAMFLAASAKIAYPMIAMTLATAINDDGAFSVIAQDASQYIQNILTTSGLTFSLIVGQTYYFMYQQQEAIYLALFEEVTMAKSLLEQVSLVAQGRKGLYTKILSCVQEYVRDDLTKFNDVEPAELLSRRPIDDPLEEILYLTSVGEPSSVYQTVRSLRQARSARLGALQRKLPQIHMVLLWTLAGIALFTFPLLGAGSQTIGGPGILIVQSWYLSFIVFGICLTMGVINELRRPGQTGAYNAGVVLDVMVSGLEEELDLRLKGVISGPPDLSLEPSIDSDGWLDVDAIISR